MKTPRLVPLLKFTRLCAFLLLLNAPRTVLAQPTAAALAGFNAYSNRVEARLLQQHRSPLSFLSPTSLLQPGQLLIEQLTPTTTHLDGALLHHWRGTAFAPGAHAADFDRLLRDVNAYPQHFAPDVTQARILSTSGNHMQTFLRIRQHHILTVVMDTTYDVTYGQLDLQHGYSISRSTRIDEIADPNTPTEHVLTPAQEHGFLWHLNTYWSYEERDGGLYLQIETVSLSRSIPAGLAWAIGPFVESIPRGSIEFTLRSAVNAIRN
jgi:hypothetical protein